MERPKHPSPAAPPHLPSDTFSPYPGFSWRKRLLIAALAAVIAIGIVILMLYPPGGVQRKRPPPPPDVAACGPAQTQDCVGSTTQVLTPASAASTPSH